MVAWVLKANQINVLAALDQYFSLLVCYAQRWNLLSMNSRCWLHSHFILVSYSSSLSLDRQLTKPLRLDKSKADSIDRRERNRMMKTKGERERKAGHYVHYFELLVAFYLELLANYY